MDNIKLKDILPYEFMNGEYDDTKAYKLREKCVQVVFDGSIIRWPGRHKYVYSWVLLVGGTLVGWNENPSRGWSFPVMQNPGTQFSLITKELTARMLLVGFQKELSWNLPRVNVVNPNIAEIQYNVGGIRYRVNFKVVQNYLGWLRMGKIGRHTEMPEDFYADLNHD